jgi:hypothetical protein
MRTHVEFHSSTHLGHSLPKFGRGQRFPIILDSNQLVLTQTFYALLDEPIHTLLPCCVVRLADLVMLWVLTDALVEESVAQPLSGKISQKPVKDGRCGDGLLGSFEGTNGLRSDFRVQVF